MSKTATTTTLSRQGDFFDLFFCNTHVCSIFKNFLKYYTVVDDDYNQLNAGGQLVYYDHERFVNLFYCPGEKQDGALVCRKKINIVRVYEFLFSSNDDDDNNDDGSKVERLQQDEIYDMFKNKNFVCEMLASKWPKLFCLRPRVYDAKINLSSCLENDLNWRIVNCLIDKNLAFTKDVYGQRKKWKTLCSLNSSEYFFLLLNTDHHLQSAIHNYFTFDLKTKHNMNLFWFCGTSLDGGGGGVNLDLFETANDFLICFKKFYVPYRNYLKSVARQIPMLGLYKNFDLNDDVQDDDDDDENNNKNVDIIIDRTARNFSIKRRHLAGGGDRTKNDGGGCLLGYKKFRADSSVHTPTTPVYCPHATFISCLANIGLVFKIGTSFFALKRYFETFFNDDDCTIQQASSCARDTTTTMVLFFWDTKSLYEMSEETSLYFKFDLHSEPEQFSNDNKNKTEFSKPSLILKHGLGEAKRVNFFPVDVVNFRNNISADLQGLALFNRVFCSKPLPRPDSKKSISVINKQIEQVSARELYKSLGLTRFDSLGMFFSGQVTIELEVVIFFSCLNQQQQQQNWVYSEGEASTDNKKQTKKLVYNFLMPNYFAGAWSLIPERYCLLFYLIFHQKTSRFVGHYDEQRQEHDPKFDNSKTLAAAADFLKMFRQFESIENKEYLDDTKYLFETTTSSTDQKMLISNFDQYVDRLFKENIVLQINNGDGYCFSADHYIFLNDSTVLLSTNIVLKNPAILTHDNRLVSVKNSCKLTPISFRCLDLFKKFNNMFFSINYDVYQYNQTIDNSDDTTDMRMIAISFVVNKNRQPLVLYRIKSANIVSSTNIKVDSARVYVADNTHNPNEIIIFYIKDDEIQPASCIFNFVGEYFEFEIKFETL